MKTEKERLMIKGMLDENQKSNKISNVIYNSKKMLDENEKSNERREGGKEII